jgi:hypothetical protein
MAAFYLKQLAFRCNTLDEGKAVTRIGWQWFRALHVQNHVLQVEGLAAAVSFHQGL